jgi:hypothetical protein
MINGCYGVVYFYRFSRTNLTRVNFPIYSIPGGYQEAVIKTKEEKGQMGVANRYINTDSQ